MHHRWLCTAAASLHVCWRAVTPRQHPEPGAAPQLRQHSLHAGREDPQRPPQALPHHQAGVHGLDCSQGCHQDPGGPLGPLRALRWSVVCCQLQSFWAMCVTGAGCWIVCACSSHRAAGVRCRTGWLALSGRRFSRCDQHLAQGLAAAGRPLRRAPAAHLADKLGHILSCGCHASSTCSPF